LAQRIPQLDGVRALAILAVFVHHALHVKLLWMGVDLFFILSGFLITGVLLDAKKHTLGKYFSQFYERRARRILIPYVLFLALASLVFGVAWMQHWYLYILLTNFLMPLRIPRPAAFDPLWSLAVEEQFYLVWPFAVYFLGGRRLRQFCVLLMVLAPFLRGAVHFQQHWPIYTLTPFRMDLLAAGALLCIEWRSHRETIERWGTRAGGVLFVVGGAGLALLMFFGVSTYANTRVGNVLIYEANLCICLGIIIYALAGRGVGWLRIAPLQYIGKISYSMYLVHVGILVIVGMWITGLPAAAASLALTIGYGAISWSLLESRLLGKSKRKAPLLVKAV